VWRVLGRHALDAYAATSRKSKMTFYPLRDNLNFEECKKFGVKPFTSFKMIGPSGSIKAVTTGEKRPPKKGEWYLSGAIVEAYRAPNDFLPNMIYHIARLVKTETRTVIVETK
jgi:hypothetical protein